MRPVPPHSTDLLYSDNHDPQDLIALGEALGVSDLKIITTATLKPERVLYHACLNGIQTYVKLSAIEETARATEIADLADAMYEALLPAFIQNVRSTAHALNEKKQEVQDFCHKIHAQEGSQTWDEELFHSRWNPAHFPVIWQQKAIETFALMSARIASGKYMPPEGITAENVTAEWGCRNREYKHYRDLARTLVEHHITSRFSDGKRLTMYPAHEREMIMFIGGMGSGKSEMTHRYLEQLPAAQRQDRVLHNADYLKLALFRSAMRDGILPTNHDYTGAETQAESSNALYEGTRKRAYLAQQGDGAPHVALNSIVLGTIEAQEGISGGGKITAHHVFIAPQDAVKEADLRGKAGGRKPAPADIAWSSAASAKSLLTLTDPEFRNSNITVHLYTRKAGHSPEHYGTIDVAKNLMQIDQLAGLQAMAHILYPEQSPQEATEKFLAQFRAAGFEVRIAPEQQQPRNWGNLAQARERGIPHR